MIKLGLGVLPMYMAMMAGCILICGFLLDCQAACPASLLSHAHTIALRPGRKLWWPLSWLAACRYSRDFQDRICVPK